MPATTHFKQTSYPLKAKEKQISLEGGGGRRSHQKEILDSDYFNMNPSTYSRLRLILVSLFAGSCALIGQTITNPGFESGTAPVRGTPAGIAASGADYTQNTFATGSYTDSGTPTNKYDDTFSAANSGGASVLFQSTAPTGWGWAGSGSTGNGRREQWVFTRNTGNTPITGVAKGGSGYAYISTIGDVVTGNDDCLQNSITGLTVNSWYTLSFWAADAGSYTKTSGTLDAADLGVPVEPGTMANRTRVGASLVFELATGGSTFTQKYFDSRGDVASTPGASGVWYFKQDLASNAAWSDRSTTVIPWEQVNFTFKATATSMNFWMSSYNNTANTVRSIVLDSLTVAVAPAPEASTYGLISVGSLLALVALRRKPRQTTNFA